jgi:hypothetical protein
VHSRATKARLAPQTLAAEEVYGAMKAMSDAGATPSAERLGDLLMGIVALAAERGLNAEDALRMAVRRYREAVAANEARR